MTQPKPTAGQPESARALLYRHGLPEDVIDGTLCLHAQELAAVQRRAHDEQRPYFHLGLPCKPEYDCGVAKLIDLIEPGVAALPAVVEPAADRAAVCICGHTEQQHFEDVCITEITGCDCGDFMTPEAAREVIDRWQKVALGKTTDRAAALWAADFAEGVAESLRKHHEFERAKGALDVMTELRRMADETPATEAQRCACTHAPAMHTGPGRFCAVPGCDCEQYAAGARQDGAQS